MQPDEWKCFGVFRGSWRVSVFVEFEEKVKILPPLGPYRFRGEFSPCECKKQKILSEEWTLTKWSMRFEMK